MRVRDTDLTLRTRVRVISLTSAVDRRSSFTAAARTRLNWQFFDALTQLAPALEYDEAETIVRRGRPLRPAEIGCYSSHYMTWVDFLESDDHQLLVLEDDVLVDWGYVEVVAAHDFAGDGIHYVRLASTAIPPSINKGEYLGRYLFHFVGYALGAQAYLLTRAGAKHLLSYARRVHGPIDDVLDQTWWGSLPNLAIYQHPVTGRHAPSNIGTTRDEAFTVPWALRLRRLMFRVQEKIRSRGYRVAARMNLVATARGDARWL